MPSQIKDAYLAPLGYQQLTSISSATALTVPAKATVAIIQPETKDVRWRDDGTSPTAGIGIVIAAGDSLVYSGNLSAIKFIEVAATGKLNVSYYE